MDYTELFAEIISILKAIIMDTNGADWNYISLIDSLSERYGDDDFIIAWRNLLLHEVELFADNISKTKLQEYLQKQNNHKGVFNYELSQQYASEDAGIETALS